MKATNFGSRVSRGFGKESGLDLEESESGVGVGFWRNCQSVTILESGFMQGFGGSGAAKRGKDVGYEKASDFGSVVAALARLGF